MLERGLRLCDIGQLPTFFILTAASLGYAYVLSGRVAEALPLLERALEEADRLGFLEEQALYSTWLSEAYLRPAGAFVQKVTVSSWKKSVVMFHNRCGVKGLTFFHQYCRNLRSLPVFFHIRVLSVSLYDLGVVFPVMLALTFITA